MSAVTDFPYSLKGVSKPPTDVFDSITNVYPVTPSSFTVSNSTVKTTFYIPNIANLRLSELYLEGNFTVGFSSTDGKDTFAVVQPAFVPYFSSLVNRVTLTIGSVQIIDNLTNNLRYNLHQNIRTNSLTAYEETLNNPKGAWTGGTAAISQFGRFQFTKYYDELFSAQRGILPLGTLPRVQLDVYFDIPDRVMWRAAGAGTITFNYSVDSLRLQIDTVRSSLLSSVLTQKGISICHSEWYYQQLALAAGTVSVSLQVATQFRYLNKLVGVITKLSDETSQTNQHKLQVYSDQVTSTTKYNARLNAFPRFPEPLVGDEVLAELRRCFPESGLASFFSDPSNTKTTHAVFCAEIGNCYDRDMESGYNTTTAQNQCYLEITFSSAIASTSNFNMFIVHDRWLVFDNRGNFDIIS